MIPILAFIAFNFSLSNIVTFSDQTDYHSVIILENKDDHVRGLYLSNIVGRKFNDDASSLRKRVGNVWFDGEATTLDVWHATTAGAWDTGEEAG